jgi:hypothetical protein
MLHLHSPDDPPSEGEFDAVVYDLDSMAPDRREELVARLLATRSTCVVAVHAYRLDADADALRGQGVIVTRRPGPAVLGAYNQAADFAVTPAPPLETQGASADRELVGEITVSALGIACRDR